MIERFLFICLLEFVILPGVSLSEESVKQPTQYSFTLQNQIVRFSSNGDLLDIQSFHNYCGIIKFNRIFNNQNDLPFLKLTGFGSSISDSCLQAAPYTIDQLQSDTTVSFFFSSSLPSGVLLTKGYSFHKKNLSFEYSVKLDGGTEEPVPEKPRLHLQITFPEDLRNGGRFVYSGKKVKSISIDKQPEIDTLRRDHWTGIQNRFWGCLIKSDGSEMPMGYKKGSLTITLSSDISQSSGLKIYCGPVVHDELKKVDHNLSRLLYQLPFWMRWLSFGFLFIFDTLLKLFHSVPLSLFLLSVCVKIVLAPLFKLASIWQKQVNRQSSLLQPMLDEIKKKFKGEEQTRKTLEAYKELGISPLYSLKSLLSAAIQIPVFFAAYHMLSEHIALSSVAFLWISDLSFPDHLFRFPFSIPFFGEYFNILPFIMTCFTIASSWIHTDPSLSVQLQKKQRKNLYWMAAIFFLLLYTSPAGMVIYWTMNNILAFLASLFEFKLQQARLKKTQTGATGNL